MKIYLDLLRSILVRGTDKPSARAGMPRTRSLFGYQMRHNLADGFPLLTTKRLSFKNIVTELIWFMRGDTNIRYLVDNGCNIWNEDAYNYYLKGCKKYDINALPFEQFVEEVKTPTGGFDHLKAWGYSFGDCGKQYGWLWRKWDKGDGEVVDQLQEIIDGLRNNPMGRRHIINAWNPATLDDMALNACHVFVQFNCRPLPVVTDDMESPKYYLDCQMYQRSADVFLGVPYNIASYGLLTHIVAKLCNMIPGEFVHTFGDVHIYEDHMSQVEEQLSRAPSALPVLGWNTEAAFENGPIDLQDFVLAFEYEDLRLDKYNPQATIKAKLSTGLK